MTPEQLEKVACLDREIWQLRYHREVINDFSSQEHTLRIITENDSTFLRKKFIPGASESFLKCYLYMVELEIGRLETELANLRTQYKK